MADPFNKKLVWDESLIEIESASRKPEYPSIGLLAGALRSCGTYLSAQGVVAVSDGDLRGWKTLRLAEDYRYWSCRIFIKRWEATGSEEGRLPATLTNIEWVLLESVISYLPAQCAWLAPWLEHQLLEGYFAESGGREIASFSVALGKMLGGGSMPEPDPKLPLGVYSELFEAWNDEQKLSKAIANACEFHISCARDNNRNRGEFVSTPHNILPTEYLALRQVRKAQGLATPKPKHPLLDTPFAEPPDPLPVVEDELLNRAIPAVRKVLPDL